MSGLLYVCHLSALGEAVLKALLQQLGIQLPPCDRDAQTAFSTICKASRNQCPAEMHSCLSAQFAKQAGRSAHAMSLQSPTLMHSPCQVLLLLRSSIPHVLWLCKHGQEVRRWEAVREARSAHQ